MMQSSHAPMNIPQISSRRRNRLLLLSTCQPTTSRPVHNQKQKQNNRNFHFSVLRPCLFIPAVRAVEMQLRPSFSSSPQKKNVQSCSHFSSWLTSTHTHTSIHPTSYTTTTTTRGKVYYSKNFIFFSSYCCCTSLPAWRDKRKTRRRRFRKPEGLLFFVLSIYLCVDCCCCWL